MFCVMDDIGLLIILKHSDLSSLIVKFITIYIIDFQFEIDFSGAMHYKDSLLEEVIT